jgi:zinc protease
VTARVITERSSDAPLVWIDVAIGGGAAADPIGAEGLHRHAALLARRGAGDRDRRAFDEALDSLGAAIDVTIGRDSVTLSALALTRNAAPVAALLADILAAPGFADDEHARLGRESPQLLDEVRDDDAALATRWFDREVCPGHPYARTALGTEASLAALDRAAAAALWRREVAVDNLVIGIAGDVSEAGAARLAATLTERLPARAERPPVEVPPAPDGGPARVSWSTSPSGPRPSSASATSGRATASPTPRPCSRLRPASAGCSRHG